MNNKKGLHFIISGRVQGVFFRATTKSKAIELGISGWVSNLPDGRVEVFAYAEPTQLSELEGWLWKGPSAAQVTDVLSSEIPWESCDGFLIKN